MLSLPIPARSISLLATSILIFVLASAIFAQGSGRDTTGTGGSHIIQGRIFFSSGRRADGAIQVKLESFRSAELSTIADSNGSFMFTSLAPGNYTVVVNAGENFEVARESVTIDSDLNLSRAGIPSNPSTRRYSVIVTLQPKRGSQDRRKPSVINAALAEVPEAARALYQQSLEFEKAGQSAKAIDNLKIALSLYPKFPLALNELGVQYLKIGQANKAVEPLRSAVKLSPDAFTPKLNFGVALLEMQQFAEAEMQLREALKIGATPTTHMYLGLALAHLNNGIEAEKELKAAIDLSNGQLSIAHYYLGGLLAKTRISTSCRRAGNISAINAERAR
ncbi:MAG TPA: tetratricopeptide repeat protein, partial [Blastocatellia bacterium]|nr:tetratricopeptide repeat protein [Blastocatellia bacterium]